MCRSVYIKLFPNKAKCLFSVSLDSFCSIACEGVHLYAPHGKSKIVTSLVNIYISAKYYH